MHNSYWYMHFHLNFCPRMPVFWTTSNKWYSSDTLQFVFDKCLWEPWLQRDENGRVVCRELGYSEKGKPAWLRSCSPNVSGMTPLLPSLSWNIQAPWPIARGCSYRTHFLLYRWTALVTPTVSLVITLQCAPSTEMTNTCSVPTTVMACNLLTTAKQ